MTAIGQSGWNFPLSKVVQWTQAALETALETGNREALRWAYFHRNQACYFAGIPLDKLAAQLACDREAIADLQQPLQRDCTDILQRCIFTLTGTHGIQPLAAMVEITIEPGPEGEISQNVRQAAFYQHFHQGVLHYLFDDVGLAGDQLGHAHRYFQALQGELKPYVAAAFQLYWGLVNAALLRLGKGPMGDRLVGCRGQVTEAKIGLKTLTSHGGGDCLHRWQLVAAEEKRALAADLEMLDLYGAAIAGAQEQGLVMEAAIAHERVADFYRERGQSVAAAAHLEKAYQAYGQWGATGKLADLETRYPDLSGSSQPSGGGLRSSTAGLSNPSQSPDAQSSAGSQEDTNAALAAGRIPSIFETAVDAVLLLSDTGFLDCNQAAVELFRFNCRADVFGLSPSDISPEWQPGRQRSQRAARDMIHLARTQGSHKFEWLHQRTNGEQFWAEVSLMIPPQDGADPPTMQLYTLVRDISSRKAAEAAMLESEVYYHQLFEQSPIGLLLCRITGEFVYANQAFAGLLGYPREDIIGLGYWTVTPQKYTETEQAQLEILQTTGRYGPYEKEYIHRDGHRFPVRLSGVIVQQNGESFIWSTVEDISDHHRTEQALRVSEAKFRRLLSNLDGAVYRCRNDSKWTMEFMSDAISKLSGYPASDFIDNCNRTYASIVHPDDLQVLEEAVEQGTANNRPFSLEYRVVHRDGSVRWVSDRGKGITDENGKLAHLEGVVLDISDRKYYEEEILRKSHVLEQTLIELKQAQIQLIQGEKMSALGSLMAGIAHEINNPIGCIIGNIDATQHYINDLLEVIDCYGDQFPEPGEAIEETLDAVDLGFVREDLPKLMKAMGDSGVRIRAISNGLRTFSRADRGDKQSFDLHEGLDSTLLILKHRLKGNDCRPAIKVTRHYGVLPDVTCFPGQLNQVFMNLLANAIDALDEASQGRTFADIEETPNWIDVTTAVQKEWVTVTIADNGVGIPTEKQTTIFEHLFTTKAVGKGTGLGLAIARQIVVDAHGGRIEVESTVGQGTQFHIVLPVG